MSDPKEPYHKILILEKQLEIARGIIGAYAEHGSICILSQWSRGEPTPDGGYRTMYAGKWHQTKPVNKTPKCNCGFDELYAKMEAVR